MAMAEQRRAARQRDVDRIAGRRAWRSPAARRSVQPGFDVLLEIVGGLSERRALFGGAAPSAFMNADTSPFLRDRYLSRIARRSASFAAAASSLSNCCLSEGMSMRFRQSLRQEARDRVVPDLLTSCNS